MRVLYIFSGNRKDKFHGKIGKDFPDTQFYGYNHLSQFDIEADARDQSDIVSSKLLRKVLGFRFTHFLTYFFVKDYDVVFGSSILYTLFFQRIYKRNTKFVLFNISLTRTLETNKGKLRFTIITWLLGAVDGVVCLASDQQDILEQMCPALKGKIYMVPLGIDVEFYKKIQAEKKDYILSAGRDGGRDYSTVIEIAKLIPERQFQIVCSRRNMRGIDNIPKNITIFYDIKPSELYQKYKEARAMLLLTFGNLHDGSDCSGQTVLLETMATGTPTIVTEAKYLLDYVVDGEDALVVSPQDAQGAAEKLRSILADEELVTALPGAALKKTNEQFSTEKMASKLAEIFTEIIE